MNLLIKKVAPTLAVLTVLVYCCWPDAEAPATKDSKDKKREIAQGALAPKAAPLPARDPFQGSAMQTPTPKQSAKSTSAVTKPVLAGHTTKQAASLTLRATFLNGERRLALINDRFYAEGESLRPTTSNTPYVIAEVEAQRVVLEHQAQRVELKYPDHTAKSRTLSTTAVRKAAKVNPVRK